MNLTDIWNTPGFFYAVGYSMCTAILLWQERTGRGSCRKWLSGILTWLFISTVIQITNGCDGALFVFTMLAVASAMLVCFYINVEDAPRAEL